METRRLVLLMVFSLSLLMLWDNYQASIGKPTLFGISTSKNVESAKSNVANGKQANLDVPNALPSSASPVEQSSAITGAHAQVITIKTDVLALDFTTLGAQLVGSRLLKHPDSQDHQSPVHLFDQSTGRVYLGQVGLIGVSGAPNHRSTFEYVSGPTSIPEGANSLDLVFKSTGGGLNVEYVYTIYRGRYDIGFKSIVTNETAQPLSPNMYMQITRDGNDLPSASKFYSTFTGPAIFSPEGKYQKIKFKNISDNSAKYTKDSDSGWLALVQHYFVSAIIPQGGPRQNYTLKAGDNLFSVGMKSSLGLIAPNQSKTYSAIIYTGPQNQHILSKLSPGLDLVVDYGWLTVIAKPIYWLLEKIHSVVNNWGWSIVLLTMCIKLLFFPLSAASYKSMAKMRKVAPRMKQLKEQHGDDKMGLQRAMMEMYKREKINPLGGCVPIVVQIPVFISLYWVLLASIEMRNAPWIGWVHDLAIPDPYYILPVIMALTMFLQTRLNPTPPDPMQAKLMMIMPLVFSFMFLFFPAGLVLYWVVNNILSITQQWVITRRIESA